MSTDAVREAGFGPDLRGLLETALQYLYPRDRTSLQGALRDLRDLLGALHGPSHGTKYSEGQTIPADVPWLAVFPEEAVTDPTSGYYVVYLFAADGSAVNLCIGLGTQKVGTEAALNARRPALQAALGDIVGTGEHPVLNSATDNAKRYGLGTAACRTYTAPLPSNDDLLDDLASYLAAVDEVHARGVRFVEAYEPMHVLLPWVEETAGIITTRRAIAEEHGSSWWVSPYRIAESKMQRIQQQLDDEVPTRAYLYRAGDSWAAEVYAITTSVGVVQSDPRLLAPNWTPAEGKLCVRLGHFEKLPTSWRGEGLVSANKGMPIGESLRGRPTFSYVYQTTPAFAHSGSSTPQAIPEDNSVPLDMREELSSLADESGLAIELLQEVMDALSGTMPQVILAGPPGTGKTWLAQRLGNIGSLGVQRWDLVQFHPSYSYEDFMEGLRPVASGGTFQFSPVKGTLLQFVNDMTHSGRDTLLIDEMNRANIPSVFGELLYLLEYRDKEATLRLSGNFKLPKELRFIATMNTADRSIRSLDAALRRRFEAFELLPDVDVLSGFYDRQPRNDVPDLCDGFVRLNDLLTTALDRHHTVGHTFFMTPHMTASHLRRVWTRKVKPLVEEYFFDEPDRVDRDFVLEVLWPSLS